MTYRCEAGRRRTFASVGTRCISGMGFGPAGERSLAALSSALQRADSAARRIRRSRADKAAAGLEVRFGSGAVESARWDRTRPRLKRRSARLNVIRERSASRRREELGLRFEA